MRTPSSRFESAAMTASAWLSWTKVFAESTAIGVRATESDRLVLERRAHRVVTRFGRIGVKLVWDADGAIQVSAEYDDCKRAAKRAGVPLREVVRAAEEAGRELA